ncbi:MAG: hypothetical protein H6994_00760 [Pseudomonadales bacterium]|nr:hypothetical protein [Pseudomonadales bacterium]
MPIFKGTTEITSLELWETLGGPKSTGQWVDGRSAKEAARAWLHDGGRTLPEEVAAVLQGHPDFGIVRSWQAEPEAKLRFDSFAGEPRNSDVLAIPEDSNGAYVVSVEAKADEPFGAIVSVTLADARKRKEVNPRSNGIERVEQLATALFGESAADTSALADLRYQLLTATAGALCEAERRGVTRAVLLIHEFRTSKTSDEKHAANAADLNHFVQRLTGGAVQRIGKTLAGPFQVPGIPLVSPDIRLYIGKVTRNLRD